MHFPVKVSPSHLGDRSVINPGTVAPNHRGKLQQGGERLKRLIFILD